MAKFDIDSALAELDSITGIPGLAKGILGVENPDRNPAALNKNSDGTTDHGLFQINSQHESFLKRSGISQSIGDLNDPAINTNAAKALILDLKRQGAKTVEQYAAGYNTGKISNTNHPYVGKVRAAMGTEDNAGALEADTASSYAGASGGAPVLQTKGAAGTNLSMNKEYPGMNAMLAGTRDLISIAGTAATDALTAVKNAVEPTLDNISRLMNANVELSKGNSAQIMKQEADTAAILGVFGLDKNVMGNKLAATAAAADALVAQHGVAYDKYAQLAGTSFFDNPISWLGAQLAMPKAAAEVNALSAKHESLTSAVARDITLATTGIQASILAKSTIDQKQAEALASVEYIKGVQKLIDTGVVGAEKGAELLKGAAVLSIQDMHVTLAAIQADFKQQDIRFNEGLKGMAADAKAEQIAQAETNIRIANGVLGTDYNIQQFKGNAKAAEIVNRIGSLGTLGNDIPEVLHNAQYLNKNNPKNAGLVVMLDRIGGEYNRQLGNADFQIKYPNVKEREAEAGRLIKERFKDFLKDASNGAEANPYRSASPAALLADPVLTSKIPMLAKIMTDGGFATQGNPVAMDAIVKTIRNVATTGADGKGRVPDFQGFEQLAAELGTYGDAVAKRNNETWNYSRIGMPTQDALREKVTGLLKGNSGVVTFSFANRGQIANILYQAALATRQAPEALAPMSTTEAP